MFDGYKRSGVYIITNIINHKIYVGSSLNIFSRWSRHKYHLKLNNHHSAHLQNAYNKHGAENFKFGVLEYCKDKLLLAGREQIWLNYFRSYDKNFGYNMCAQTYSTVGKKHSENTKQKISKSHMGKVISNETKIKMSIAKLGKRHPQSSYDKTGLAHKGKKHSEETKLKMSIAKKGRVSGRRRLDKWPCPNGSKCKCQNCMNKTNQLVKSNKLKRKNKHD